MNKKNVAWNIAFLAVAIFVFVCCMINGGFSCFEGWQNLNPAFESSFFAGMLFFCMPITLVFSMILILVAIYALLKSLNVIKENAFDKAFAIIEKVAVCVFVASIIFVTLGAFYMLNGGL